jgi:hypothetical protein
MTRRRRRPEPQCELDFRLGRFRVHRGTSPETARSFVARGSDVTRGRVRTFARQGEHGLEI